MIITNHPLHRSGRALLTHPAPVLGLTMSLNSNRLRVSATGRTCPAQCPVPAARTRMPFDQPPSLHLLRAALRRQFVRRLRRYYAAVRLPAAVHHRRTSLDFTMRPKRRRLGDCRISRFSRKLLPCLPGVSDRAGYQRPSPARCVGCCLPPASTGSASRTKPFSRLNTQPTLSPVNASPDGLLHMTHDSGPLWLATPLTYDSFIHYNLPVYPGALRRWPSTPRGLPAWEPRLRPAGSWFFWFSGLCPIGAQPQH